MFFSPNPFEDFLKYWNFDQPNPLTVMIKKFLHNFLSDTGTK